MPLGAGTRLGSYEILSPLGAGGMGEVYRARHLKLEREVAIKVLPHELASDPERLHRFEREARAASALNHPSIVTIYDIDEHEGTLYIAMELVEGRTLRELLADGPLPSSRTLPIARQVAEGLAKAHAAGIVHRDLKPDNVMVTDDGLVKILDFGLAKRVPPDADFESEMTMMSRTTAEGAVLGTVPYMSPEQAAGRPLDHRSDQFSLGVVLYELLCGQRPFQGSSVATVLSAIMRDTPSPLRSLRPETPKYVEGVVQRCLEKDPRMRYASSGELARELLHCEEQLAAAQRGPTVALRRPVVAAVLALLVVVAGVPTWLWWRGSRARWAHEEALPEITRLTESGEIYEAYRVALEAKKHIPGNAELQRVLARITLPVSVVTDPPGARVFVKGYATPEAAWEPLGETPLEQVRIPYALMRWKISKEGFETFEGAPLGEGPFVALARGFPLDPVGTRPEGMVRVPGGHFARPDLPAVEISDYWLDRYEVTNRQFEKFVDAGAYRKREYWTQPFLEDGRELSWEQAIARFRDKTGRPGPSMWELGTHADAREDHPVGGVSWYEAAAYCTFAGGSLPTVYHWYNATVQDQISDIVRLSNFGGEGPSAVGSHPGLGDYGTYDMAGNVKEWCWNATGDRRYVLGGAWSEPTYMFRLEADARLPFERSATHGFRCARFPDPLDDTLLGPVPVKKHGNEKPVTDEVFEAYRRMYAYDRTDLAARVEAVDDSSPHWRKETVSFDAAYGNERVSAHLFLPRSAAPPYQAVVWFPGNDAFFPPSSQSLASAYLFDFIPRSGRVLVYPVYKGMYERRAPFSRAGNDWRDMVIMWSKDLGRTLDYLKTREDVDHEKLAYYGFSLGSIYGPVFTAVDQRFRASVLLAGGLRDEATPEMAVMNFASRSRVPTLMVSGMDDFILPLESAQRPLFRLLGAPEADKRHAQLEGGHIPSDRREIIREVLDWLDRYLGPVQTPGPSSTAG